MYYKFNCSESCSIIINLGNAQGETRTRTNLSSTDFKSAASTIPPPGLGGDGRIRTAE